MGKRGGNTGNGFDKRTPEERKRIATLGGQASSRAKRKPAHNRWPSDESAQFPLQKKPPNPQAYCPHAGTGECSCNENECRASGEST